MSTSTSIISPLLKAEDLAIILGKAAGSIYNDSRKRPETLPPRFFIPGNSRLLRWHPEIVQRWLSERAEECLTMSPLPPQKKQKIDVAPEKRRVGRPTKAESIAKAKADGGAR